MVDLFKFHPSDRTVDSRQRAALYDDPAWQFRHRGTFNPEENDSLSVFHTEKRIKVVIRNGKISSVQANASRLYTGRGDNLHVLQNQRELDQALEAMWGVLDMISTGDRSGEFKKLEVGGIINEPFDSFERLLRYSTHPWILDETCRYHRRSMCWGSRKHDRLFLKVYDKGPQGNKKNFTPDPLPVNTYTRLEMRLHGKAIFKKVFGQDRLKELNFDQLRQAFFRTFMKFNAAQADPVIPGDGKLHHLVALVNALPSEQRMLNGQDILDLWLGKRPDRSRRDVLLKAANFKVTANPRSLRDILSPDSDVSLLTQIPVPIDPKPALLVL